MQLIRIIEKMKQKIGMDLIEDLQKLNKIFFFSLFLAFNFFLIKI